MRGDSAAVSAVNWAFNSRGDNGVPPGASPGRLVPDAHEILQAPRLTFRQWTEAIRVMRDKTYQTTPLGRDVVAYLAWKRLSRAAPRTLDQYERDLRLICL